MTWDEVTPYLGASMLSTILLVAGLAVAGFGLLVTFRGRGPWLGFAVVTLGLASITVSAALPDSRIADPAGLAGTLAQEFTEINGVEPSGLTGDTNARTLTFAASLGSGGTVECTATWPTNESEAPSDGNPSLSCPTLG